jgi:hypothetical protein
MYCIGSCYTDNARLYTKNASIDEIEPYIDSNSRRYGIVFVHPNWGIWEERWYLKVPVKNDYCEKHQCLTAQERLSEDNAIKKDGD